MDIKQFDLKALADAVVDRPATESCEVIDQLLQALPLWSSFINKNTPRGLSGEFIPA